MGERPVLVAHPGAELYGADRVVLETVVALVGAGLPVIVTVPTDGPLVPRLRREGADIVLCRAPVLRRSALRPRGVWQLVRDATAGIGPALRLVRGCRLVYVNTLTIPSWVLLARLAGRPVVCHVHEAERSAPAAVRRLLAWPAALATRVVVNSEFTREVIHHAAGPRATGRSVLIYNSVPGPAVVQPPRPAIDGPVRLLFVGRLSPRKGPQIALSALARLRDEGLEASLELVGSVFPGYEWFEAKLRRLVREAGLDSCVRFHGFHDDVWAAMAVADVVVVPSVQEESFGNVAVEGVLAARPVVVSAFSGLCEAIAGVRSAIAVPRGSASRLAEAVATIVGAWPQYTASTMDDSNRARRRFAPARYRAEVARLVLSLGGPP